MVPDRGFVKQLKKLNPHYEVLWDWGSEKGEIWKIKEGLEAHITTIQTRDKGYRDLGADVLLKLQAGDTTRFTAKELYAYFEEMDNQVQRRKRKDLMNKIEAIAMDSFSYAQGIMQVQVPRKFKIGRVINA